MTDLTAASADLLRLMLEIASERDWCPLMDGDLTPAQRGNLSDLKKKGLVWVAMEDDTCLWYDFSDEARA